MIQRLNIHESHVELLIGLNVFESVFSTEGCCI
jgi:hypothetical protein